MTITTEELVSRLTQTSIGWLLCSCLAIFVVSCASIQPPPGGPVDSTGAQVDTTMPFNRETNVPTDSRIKFEFDRNVDRASFMQALSITPYVNGIIQYNWSGYDEVSVELPTKLRDSTTYTVELSRDLKSKHGVGLTAPIRLSFSTGPAIDTGSLSGFLLAPFVGDPIRASQIFVFAYDITVRNPDTLNFAETPPDLLTQANDQGAWQFLAMKTGHRYRVFAVADVYRNHLYDAGVDGFGVPPRDATLDSAVKTNFYIRMSPPTDTTRPELQDVEIVDSFHVRARFSEAIDSNDVLARNFHLAPTSIVAAFRENDKRPGQVTLVTSAPIPVATDLILQVDRDSVRDLAKNRVSDSAFEQHFRSPDDLHSVGEVKLIAFGLTDSVTDIPILPALPISFSDAVDRTLAEQGVEILDTSGKPVPAKYRWLDDAHVYLSPADSLMSNLFYTVQYLTSKFRSPVARIPHDPLDTIYRYHFRTTNARQIGRLSGDITIADSFFVKDPASAIVVQAISSVTGERTQKILPHGVKHFIFDVPGGIRYRVRAYLSSSGDGVYDPGSIVPWRFGSPTGDYSGGEIEARPRWEIGNVNFEVR